MASPIKLTPELQKRLIEKMKLEVEQEMAAGKPQERLGPSGSLEPTGDPQAAPPGYNSWQAFGRDFGVESGLLQRKLDEEAGIPPLPPLPGPSPEDRKAVSDIEDRYERDKAAVLKKADDDRKIVEERLREIQETKSPEELVKLLRARGVFPSSVKGPEVPALFSWDTASAVNRPGAPAGSESLLSRDTPEALLGAKPTSTLMRDNYSPPSGAEVLGRWGLDPDAMEHPERLEDGFRGLSSPLVKAAAAFARYEAAVRHLELRKRLETQVQWNKSSSWGTSKTDSPLKAYIAGKEANDNKRRNEIAIYKAMREEQEKQNKNTYIDARDGKAYYMPNASADDVKQVREYMTLAASSTAILERLKEASTLDRLGPTFKAAMQPLVFDFKGMLSKAVEQGAITKDEAAALSGLDPASNIGFDRMKSFLESARSYAVEKGTGIADRLNRMEVPRRLSWRTLFEW
jgi:hypothetical protein